MSGLPLVTVIVPARDEARHLAPCVASIVGQDYPHDRIEVVVVVDGQSCDETPVEARASLAGTDLLRSAVIINGAGGTPSNLNRGLQAAHGRIICRVDARSRIPKDYVRRCTKLLETRSEVAVVGGAQVAVGPSDNAVSIGIARALNNRWGMGWSRYRRGAPSGPTDTVYLGAFRAADLRAVGGWDAAMATNQDFDLNRRLGRRRGTVWYEADLPVEYVPRATITELFRQYVRFGRWKVRYWRHTGDRPRPRQIAALLGVPALTVAAAAGLVFATPVGRVVLLVGAVCLVAAYEAIGSRRPGGDLVAHGWSAVAGCAVAAGWVGGALRELARGNRAVG